MSRFRPDQSVGALKRADGTRESYTLTLPATSAATQSDYVNIYDAAGTHYAIWLDIDADGTAPTGALYVAADTKIEVDIVGGGTAAQNGTLFYNAVNGVIADVSFVDNEDGTVDVTLDDVEDATDAVPKNADDSGAGSVTVGTITDGTSESFPYPEGSGSPTDYKINPDVVS